MSPYVTYVIPVNTWFVWSPREGGSDSCVVAGPGKVAAELDFFRRLLTGRPLPCRRRYLMWSITSWNSFVGENSMNSESSSASGAWPGSQ